jgi:DNA polymerase III epsilon subunit-like protein
MVRYLVFDTETTGLPKFGRKSYLYARNWPDLVSICWVILDGDNEVKRRYYIIQPNGWTIPEDAAKIHGITMEKAVALGEPLRTVLNELRDDLKTVDKIVAHNMNFDRNVLLHAYYWRLRDDPVRFWPNKKEVCSMLRATAPTDKWIRLDDLYERSVGQKPPTDAHNAERDVNVLIAIIKKLWSGNSYADL